MNFQWAKLILLITILLVTIIIGYASISLIIHERIIIPISRISNDEIVKKAVRRGCVRNLDYIVCRWSRVSGANFKLLYDENGNRSDTYILVTGIKLEEKLSYEFLISKNRFVFYVDERIEYFDTEWGEYVIEYKVNSWDVLYPVKRDSDSLFGFKPKYILKSDMS